MKTSLSNRSKLIHSNRFTVALYLDDALVADDAPLEPLGQVGGAVAGLGLLGRLPGPTRLPRAAVEAAPRVARAVVVALVDVGRAVSAF